MMTYKKRECELTAAVHVTVYKEVSVMDMGGFAARVIHKESTTRLPPTKTKGHHVISEREWLFKGIYKDTGEAFGPVPQYEIGPSSSIERNARCRELVKAAK